MTCAQREPLCLRVGEIKERSWDWTLHFANLWRPQGDFAAGTRTRPVRWDPDGEELVAYGAQTGLEYESSGGISGYVTNRRGEIVPPAFPAAVNATVVDGPITWTGEPLSYDSLRERIQSVEWMAPAEFTVTPMSFIDEPGRQMTPAQIEALPGAAASAIVCRVTTTEGNKYDAIFDVTIDP